MFSKNASATLDSAVLGVAVHFFLYLTIPTWYMMTRRPVWIITLKYLNIYYLIQGY